jgi:GLPGLI family protein
MMIKPGLFFFLLLSTASSFAQSKTAVAGKIFYNMAHACDTTDLSLRYRGEFVLFYGKESSLFQDYKRLVNSRNSREKMFAVKPGEVYYTFPGKNELVKAREFSTYDNPPKNYVMPEPIAAIKWKISKETKLIAGYTCQKATGYCKGRNFTAWFCPDIPFRFGPWKLSGLPGLIMEAVDDTNELSFTFNRIENEPDGSFIQLPEPNEITSEVVFEGMRKTWLENVRAMTAGIQVTVVEQPGAPKPAKILSYNKPMDLESKAPLVAYYLGN